MARVNVHENDFSLDEDHLEEASCSVSISNNEVTNNTTSGVDMIVEVHVIVEVHNTERMVK